MTPGDPKYASAQSSLKHAHKLHSDDPRLDFFKRKAKDSDYELSRYEPLVKDIMERAAGGKLNRARYPYVQESDPTRKPKGTTKFGGEDDSGMAARVRAVKYEWDWTDSAGSSRDLETGRPKNLAASLMPNARQTIIVFVIGGITFAEIRAAYDASRLSGADVYIGGTSVLTPPGIFEMLRRTKSEQAAGW